MLTVNLYCFLASYLVAFGFELARMVRRIKISRTIVLIAATAGLVAHTMYLVNRGRDSGLPPLLSSTHDWMLVLAWLVVVAYLFLTALRRKLPVGVFLMPVVLILIGAAYFVSDLPNTYVAPNPTVAREVAINNWAMLHASLLVFGITGVVVGFVLSMMYLAQHYRLKHHQAMANDLALPNLERLARLNWWAVIVSIPLLTLGMLCGVLIGLLSRKGTTPISFADPVVITNGIVWLVMIAFLAWLLVTRRPVGKQVAWMTIWAFGFLLVTLIGLQVLTAGSSAISTWHT